MPIAEEDIDGLSGLLFPFYDADTHMLYLAGKVSPDPYWDTTWKLFVKTVMFPRCTTFRSTFNPDILAYFSTTQKKEQNCTVH